MAYYRRTRMVDDLVSWARTARDRAQPLQHRARALGIVRGLLAERPAEG